MHTSTMKLSRKILIRERESIGSSTGLWAASSSLAILAYSLVVVVRVVVVPSLPPDGARAARALGEPQVLELTRTSLRDQKLRIHFTRRETQPVGCATGDSTRRLWPCVAQSQRSKAGRPQRHTHSPERKPRTVAARSRESRSFHSAWLRRGASAGQRDLQDAALSEELGLGSVGVHGARPREPERERGAAQIEAVGRHVERYLGN
jgi:hypothetical protein